MRYYNAKEAAQYVGRNEKTIRRWINEGHLKAKKEAGKFLIAKRSLEVLKGHLNGNLIQNSDMKGQITDKGETYIYSDILLNTKEIVSKLEDISDILKSSIYDENPVIDGLRQDRDRLWEENAKLLERVGGIQQENEQLKAQIARMKAAQCRKQRLWWRLGR